MAPRKPAKLRPSVPRLRRSARLQRPETPPAVDFLAPAEDPANRVTKFKPAAKRNNSTRHDCASCGRNLSKSSFPKHITDNCEHSVTTCKACLKIWISTQLDNTTYDKLACPECPQIIQNAEVKKHAANNVYERFNELERRGIAEKIPGWRWCLNPDCKAGQVHQPPVEVSSNVARTRSKGKEKKKDFDDICECDECGAKACVPCDRPYHSGETCAEYQKRLKQFEQDEEATVKIIEEVCKKCPNCHKNIQKNGGCSHMICTQCRTAFCFLCLVDYATINKQGHANGCVYAIPGAIDPHAFENNGAVHNGGGNNGGGNNGGGNNGGGNNGGMLRLNGRLVPFLQ